MLSRCIPRLLSLTAAFILGCLMILCQLNLIQVIQEYRAQEIILRDCYTK